MSKSPAKELVETITPCQIEALTSSINELPIEQIEAFTVLMQAGRMAIVERDEYIARLKNKNRNYRLQLKQLNRAHVLQKREFEHLKRAYDEHRRLVNHIEMEREARVPRRPVEDEINYDYVPHQYAR